MRLICCGCRGPLGRRAFTNYGIKRTAKAAGRLFRLGGLLAVLLVMGLGFVPGVQARQSADPADSTNSAAGGSFKERVAAIRAEKTNATQRVLEIVNRPVKAYVRSGNIDVSTFKPGWFHPGAIKPDFNTVDVRQTQELPYAQSKFVTSDLNPGIVFLGQDLEFNSMTKYFYTNRSLPKRKLTEAEMLEINRLYRIIGKCETEIEQLATQPAEGAQAAKSQGETEEIVPGQSFEAIRKIPLQTRKLYGGIGIGALLVIVIALRVFRKRSG
ncbi:MAG: hypothetical protein JWQ04_2257 [Pedosphaera sp.]|nr:hypothetical protein [Pedosphaera sp.]